MGHTQNVLSLGTEAGGSGVQSHSQLQSKFKAKLGYMRPCLKKKKMNKKSYNIIA